MSRSKIGLVAIIVLSIIALCMIAFTWLYREMETLANFDAKEEAIKNTEVLLIDIQNEREVPYMRNDRCLLFLESALRENLNKYDIEVIYYNWDNPEGVFRDVDEVITMITFPDGRGAEILWYEGGFQGCQGYQEFLRAADVDARLMEIANTELPESAINVWGIETYMNGLVNILDIRFSANEKQITAFLEQSLNFPDQLESEIDLSEIRHHPFHNNREQWNPKGLETTQGSISEWAMQDQQSVELIMMVGSVEGSDLYEMYLRFFLRNEMK